MATLRLWNILALRQASLNWTGLVGVATKIFGSADVAHVRDIVGVAWGWSDAPAAPMSLSECVVSYWASRAALPPPDYRAVDVKPELVGAISHIASRPDRPHGLYALLDIKLVEERWKRRAS